MEVQRVAEDLERAAGGQCSVIGDW